MVWGIFVRLVFAYHTTWFVNSAAHMLGYRTYRTDDHSTNCWWVALLPSARAGTTIITPFRFPRATVCGRYEIDMTWWHVRVLAFLRLADRIRIPSELMRSKLAKPQAAAEAAWKTVPSAVYC